MNKNRLIFIDLITIIVSLIVFWVCMEESNAFAYSLIFLIFINPIAILFCSFNIGINPDKKLIDYFFPLFFGIPYGLLYYFTFQLANMIANNNIQFPNLINFLNGIIIAYIGFGASYVYQYFKLKFKK